MTNWAFVTGGAGDIGSAICQALARDGFGIACVDMVGVAIVPLFTVYAARQVVIDLMLEVRLQLLCEIRVCGRSGEKSFQVHRLLLEPSRHYYGASRELLWGLP